MATIRLQNVSKRFGEVVIIPDLDLEILEGEFMVFVGPSGCGKSTLLRLIAGLEDTSGGEIYIDGKPVANEPASTRGLAMVFQSYALYPHMSVRGNIGFGLKMAGQPKDVIAAKVAKAAETLNLTPYLDRKPGQLSGGQRQRVAIGRSIVREPKAFLFDEPLSNLDAALRGNMRLEIQQLHKDLDSTMIYVTHDQVEAMTMADRIVVLDKGSIRQVGTPLELYNKPDNLFVAGFIGSPRMNLITGGENGPGVSTIGIRPEHISVAKGTGAIGGTVAIAEHLGSDTFLHIDTTNHGRITARASGDLGINPGDSIGLTFDPARIHRFDQNGKAIRSA